MLLSEQIIKKETSFSKTISFMVNLVYRDNLFFKLDSKSSLIFYWNYQLISNGRIIRQSDKNLKLEKAVS